MNCKLQCISCDDTKRRCNQHVSIYMLVKVIKEEGHFFTSQRLLSSVSWYGTDLQLNQLILTMEMQRASCDVGTEFINIASNANGDWQAVRWCLHCSFSNLIVSDMEMALHHFFIYIINPSPVWICPMLIWLYGWK